MKDKEFFLTDNKSGWKTKPILLQKNKPDIYNSIIEFSNKNNLTNLNFKQQVWHYINDVIEAPKCCNDSCSNLVKFKDSLQKGYGDFCSLSCANNSGLLNDRVITSNRIKHGVDYYSQHSDFINKVKKTKKIKYGDENYNNIDKAKLTKKIKYGNPNYNNKKKSSITIRNNFINELTNRCGDELIKYEVGDSNLTLKCNSCNNEYDIYHNLLNYRLSKNIKPCTICNKISDTNSIMEKELLDYIKSILPDTNIIEKDRDLIKPLELDIYIPEYKLAIEFNGLYWHSNKFVDTNYHLSKTKACTELGIRLIHVFEDEWVEKSDIVKSIIKTALNLNSNVIYGRNCDIRFVNNNDAKVFLDSNHIQGNVNSKIKLGLYYNNELVSVMTFGNLRKSLGSTSKEGYYELLRYSNKLGYNVVGGFSKLLKYFSNNFEVKQLISFSDRRYFTGNVYLKNGFIKLHETKPNYWYIIKHKRENRFKYRKDVLVSEGYDGAMSESEIMLSRGINKIYDCGTVKWVINY
jgi:hypothetical protein